MNNADCPTMPCKLPASDEDRQVCGAHGLPMPDDEMYSGLTKREAFAMAAMQGLCNAHDQGGTWAHDDNTVAETAVRYADELLKELEKDSAG